jgi:hypothetical protein
MSDWLSQETGQKSLLLKSVGQSSVWPDRLSHGDEVELNEIGDLVSHDQTFLTLDSLLYTHLHISIISSIRDPTKTYLQRPA